MEAALSEFSSNSYENASLNNILKAANSSKGSFYYHFRNKEDLYLKLLKQSFEEKWAFINSALTQEETNLSTLDIYEKLMLQAKLGLQFAEKHPDYHMLGKMFAGEKGNAIYNKALAELGSSASNPLDFMISEALKKGEIDSEYSKEFIQKMLSHLFSSYDEIFKDSKTQNMLAEYIRFIKQGFAPK